MPDFPWYIPVLDGETLKSYAGPFMTTTVRDAYTASYSGPDAFGDAFQAGADPNAGIPYAVSRISTAEGELIRWSDDSTTVQ